MMLSRPLASLWAENLKLVYQFPKIPASSLCTKHVSSLCAKHARLVSQIPKVSPSSLCTEPPRLMRELPKTLAFNLANSKAANSSILHITPCISPLASFLNWSPGSTAAPPGGKWLPTGALHPSLEMPTVAPNRLKVYEDIARAWKEIRDPVVEHKEIKDKPSPGLWKKEAVRMIVIRRKKMKKHKLKKLRKRMKFVYAKVKLRRALRKETRFRTELLTQVEAADMFDAKAYVENILHTLRYHPKPETDEERRERYRIIKKMNRYNTNFQRPKFDD